MSDGIEIVTTTFGTTMPRFTMRAQAVDYAEAATRAGQDWQEIADHLFNGIYAPLFSFYGTDEEPTDEDRDEATAIVRDAEERIAE